MKKVLIVGKIQGGQKITKHTFIYRRTGEERVMIVRDTVERKTHPWPHDWEQVEGAPYPTCADCGVKHPDY